ncbi:MAG TPA: single-stranded DNA-binding protein [Bacillota bacterium]|nr:single-stranded DNA-binding protein [Bacillota bacterium]HPJ86305.1 single-stranded DNA-binding protein [Bacillota bacterium]HRX91922.1 single-stranded DNA-binding protein [Candidatus Izemoplasmatales bacterium]
MLNRVVLVGRLVRDPELRYTQNNIAVVSFTLAVNRPFASSNQQNDNTADFISCTAWRKQAENISKYVNKGSMVAVDGRLQTRDYMDEKNNVRRYVTEVVCDSVVFLDSKSQSQDSGNGHNYDASDNNNNKKDDKEDSIDIIEDDLPF